MSSKRAFNQLVKEQRILLEKQINWIIKRYGLPPSRYVAAKIATLMSYKARDLTKSDIHAIGTEVRMSYLNELKLLKFIDK